MKNSIGSYTDSILIVKFNSNTIEFLSINSHSETLSKNLNNNRKFTIKKTKKDYIVEDKHYLDNLWKTKGISKYKFICI